MNNYKSLINKTEKIEDGLSSLQELTENIKNNSFSTFERKFLDLSINPSRKILLTSLNLNENINLSFELNVHFKISAKQKISFKVFANDFLLCKNVDYFEVGKHEIVLTNNNFQLPKQNINLNLEITSEDGKYISLQSTTLFIWGLNQDKPTYQYQIFNVDNYVLLSYCYNNELFFLQTTKNSQNFNKSDFEFFANAVSYCFTKSSNDLFLFRVDLNGNLFFSKFPDKEELFLSENVQHVSSVYLVDKFIVAYISSKTCYTFEIENNCISSHKKIVSLNKPLINCKLHLNKSTNKVYLVLTDEKNSNYLLESENNIENFSDNLNVSYGIYVETNGGEWWIFIFTTK